MTDEKGVGSLPDAGTIEPGDPGHIETHDEMARLMQVAADSLGIILDPPAPKPAVIGQYGHVDAHNTLLANIEQLAAAGGGGLPGELPGLGGWATITAVSGSPKRYAYPDGGTDWVAFEWTQDGTMTHSGGIADVLMVGQGGGGDADGRKGVGGQFLDGLRVLDAGTETAKPGRSGTTSVGQETQFAGLTAKGGTLGYTNGPHPEGVVSSIRGSETAYCKDAIASASSFVGLGHGQAGGSSVVGASGSVTVRVPAAQAAGVDPGSWVTRVDYYAEVTDGLVTDLYQERFYGDDTVRTENGKYASPEQPDDLIPCDPSVAEGWSYDGKEFTPPPPPPPPSREEIIAELQARMDELTKDKK